MVRSVPASRTPPARLSLTPPAAQVPPCSPAADRYVIHLIQLSTVLGQLCWHCTGPHRHLNRLNACRILASIQLMYLAATKVKKLRRMSEALRSGLNPPKLSDGTYMPPHERTSRRLAEGGHEETSGWRTSAGCRRCRGEKGSSMQQFQSGPFLHKRGLKGPAGPRAACAVRCAAFVLTPRRPVICKELC
jgi:hypothetical protein